MLPALNDRGVLKDAQTKLIALGCDWAEAGRILSQVHSTYVNRAHAAARRYVEDLA